MSKLLYAYEKDMPTVSMIRDFVHQYAECLGSENRFLQLKQITQADLDWCDVVYFIRPNDPYSVHLAKCAREAGCFVISYYDDDLYALPDSLANPPWRKKSVLRMLRESNMLDSSSPHICRKYSGLTLEKRAVQEDTIVAAKEIKLIDLLDMAAEQDQKVKLIYAANPGHVSFFNQFIMPIMPQLCERYASKISMTFMGVRPELSEYESKIDIIYHGSMPLAEYRQKIKDGNYDIGLSPMTTNEFTKCKYFNKFIEYTMAGIVGMYSNTEPYTYVVENEKNGFLVNDAPQDWYACLCKAIDDALLRNRCVRAAQELLMTEFTPERLLEKKKKMIPELVSWQGRRKPCRSIVGYSLQYRWIRLLDKAYLLFFYLRQGGLAAVLKKIRK